MSNYTISRAVDFKETGNYELVVAGVTHTINRNMSNGWWYEDCREYSIGFTKAEAIASILTRY